MVNLFGGIFESSLPFFWRLHYDGGNTADARIPR